MGLDVEDRVAGQQPRGTAADIGHGHELSVGSRGLMRAGLPVAGLALHRHRDPVQRLLDPGPADRLAQIIECVELKASTAAFSYAYEHDLGWLGEAPQNASELEAVEVGHPDVEEDRIVGLSRGQDERIVAVAGALDLLDDWRAAQQPRQIVELGALVVDGQDRQPVGAHADLASCGSAGSPRRFGNGHHRRRTLAEHRLNLQRVTIAERRPQAGVDVGETDSPPAPASTAGTRWGPSPCRRRRRAVPRRCRRCVP